MRERTTVYVRLAILAFVMGSCRDASLPPLSQETVREVGTPAVRGEEVVGRADASLPSDEAACAMTPTAVTRAPPSAHPFTRLEPQCKEGNWMCDVADDPPDPRDTCFVATQNIARAERELSHAPRGGPVSSKDWDGSREPRFLDRIDDHLHLTSQEHDKLRENGFVVLDRLPYTDYADAFHDVFQEELPLYVGIDPILQAVFSATELVLERVERKRLVPALASLLKKLRSTLSASKGIYDATTLEDLDVYLGVAHHFAFPEDRASLFAHDEAVADLAGNHELMEAELFGRTRMIDFSQLTPRGHYVPNGSDMSVNDAKITPIRLDNYFQSVMWLSRLEFNLVSRSCRSSQPGVEPDPSETPREARDALALADLVERSGVSPELRKFEEVYGAFAGRREDVSVFDLLGLMRASHFGPNDGLAPDKLKAAIGDRFQRTARVHFMPHHSPVLPAIATLLGPRIVPDIAPLTRLVHDSVPSRTVLRAADVGFVLGHDRARELLRSDLAAFPSLEDHLVAARGELRLGATAHDDSYATWLRALLALADPPRGVVPSFMRRPAFLDERMNSALVGYGQLRHTFVLTAGQGYDAYGCEIPDGYVEPLVAVYEALLAHVQKIRAVAGGYSGLERVLRTLRSIAEAELSGAPLSEPDRRWLGMVSENIPSGGYLSSGAPPKWTGWYFDMFEDREIGATKSPAFVADYFTLTNEKLIEYLGAEGPRLGVFVVDTNGEARAMVGPVAKGYETTTPTDTRLDDEKALTHMPKTDAWRTSFAVPAPPEPPLRLEGNLYECGADGAGESEWRVVMQSDRPIGAVTVGLLDHHGDSLAPPLTLDVGAGSTVYVFRLPEAFRRNRFGVEAMHVRIEDLAKSASGAGPYDWFTSPSVFSGKDFGDPETHPRRPRGVGHFLVDGTKK
jgi:Protein of unknown function (DUF3160)